MEKFDINAIQGDKTLKDLIKEDAELIAVLKELNGMVPISKLEVSRNVCYQDWQSPTPKLLLTIIVDAPGMTWKTFSDSVKWIMKDYDFYAEDPGCGFALYLKSDSHIESEDYAIIHFEEVV